MSSRNSDSSAAAPAPAAARIDTTRSMMDFERADGMIPTPEMAHDILIGICGVYCEK
jgi:hypothetical protein